MTTLFCDFEFWPRLPLTDLEISWLDCLTPTPLVLNQEIHPALHNARNVDGGHLEKWHRMRIAHTSDDVITQFRDPHNPMIGFRHTDKMLVFGCRYPPLLGGLRCSTMHLSDLCFADRISLLIALVTVLAQQIIVAGALSSRFREKLWRNYKRSYAKRYINSLEENIRLLKCSALFLTDNSRVISLGYRELQLLIDINRKSSCPQSSPDPHGFR